MSTEVTVKGYFHLTYMPPNPGLACSYLIVCSTRMLVLVSINGYVCVVYLTITITQDTALLVWEEHNSKSEMQHSLLRPPPFSSFKRGGGA